MRHQIIQPHDTNIRLMQVRAGMPVYDVLVERVGIVKNIQFSADSLDTEVFVDDAAVELAPTAIRDRLLKIGYIRISTGLLRKDFFVFADQIEDVEKDRVYLNRLRGELLTL